VGTFRTNLSVTEVYAIGAPIVLAIILLEVFISSINNKNLYKKNDTLCTIGLLTGNITMVFALKGITLAFHFYLYQFKLINLSEIVPSWLLWMLTFILIDFVFYFYHRISHRVNFLWAIHMSHHSSEEMNFAVSFRQAWFGPLSKIPFFMVLPIIGFDPTLVAVAGVISTLWGIVGHTQIINRLGPLEWFMNTPSHHRVHHGSNSQYIDKNYGNLLIIWDKMFGTFEREDEKVKFGLVKNVNTFNPSRITFMGWTRIIEDIRDAENLNEALYFIFGPPNTKGEQ
jgi:Sterol desaturase